MAQESWNKEIDEAGCEKPEGPILCANNCVFLGSAVTNNLCSKCYKTFIMKQQAMVAQAVPAVEKLPAVGLASTSFESICKGLNSVDGAHVFGAEVEQKYDLGKKQAANRCFLCRKRVGLMGFKCRCGDTFCSAHRYAEMHKCSFDYKSAGREAIAKENPVVKAEKIEKI